MCSDFAHKKESGAEKPQVLYALAGRANKKTGDKKGRGRNVLVAYDDRLTEHLAGVGHPERPGRVRIIARELERREMLDERIDTAVVQAGELARVDMRRFVELVGTSACGSNRLTPSWSRAVTLWNAWNGRPARILRRISRWPALSVVTTGTVRSTWP
ncbi:MAG: hypothetical protein ABSB70_03905 [Candidatus Velthaea sp.]